MSSTHMLQKSCEVFMMIYFRLQMFWSHGLTTDWYVLLWTFSSWIPSKIAQYPLSWPNAMGKRVCKDSSKADVWIKTKEEGGSFENHSARLCTLNIWVFLSCKDTSLSVLASYLEMNFALNKFPWTCLIPRNSFKLIIHWDQFPNKIHHTQGIDFQLHKPLVKLEEQIAKTTVGFPKLLSYMILSVYQRPARPLLLE